VEKRVKGTTYQ